MQMVICVEKEKVHVCWLVVVLVLGLEEEAEKGKGRGSPEKKHNKLVTLIGSEGRKTD